MPPALRCLLALSLSGVGLADAAGTADGPAPRPNVVVIAIDGLNDYVAPLRGFEDVLPNPEVRPRVTPNLTRLAEWGGTFTRAAAVHAGPGASHAAVWTGVRGIDARGWDDPRGPVAFPQALKSELGYTLLRAGGVESTGADWDASRVFDTGDIAPHRRIRQEVSLSNGGGPELRWSRWVPTQRRRGDDDLSVEAWERLVDSMPDQRAAAWVAEQIDGDNTDGPRLVALRLEHLNLPWDTPGVFYDRFPIDEVAAPPSLAGHPDAADWRYAIQAYLAAVSCVDFAVGKVLDAVEPANADDDPTNDWAVVLWSDHGWRLTPGPGWAPAARANLMLYAPGVTEPGQAVSDPVSLRAVAPTVLDLAGAEPLAQFQSDSLVPLVRDRLARPGATTITTYGDGPNDLVYGVRSSRFRLRHHPDGEQELYDLEKDPDEALDLLDPAHAEAIDRFGMTPEQVDSVRRWLGGRLLTDLVKAGRPVRDDSIDLAAIDTANDAVFGAMTAGAGGLSFGFGSDSGEGLVAGTASEVSLGDQPIEARQDFLAAVGGTLRGKARLSLRFGVQDEANFYELGFGWTDSTLTLDRVVDGERRSLLSRPVEVRGDTRRLLVDYSATYGAAEVLVQDGRGLNALRERVTLDEPLAPGGSLNAEIETRGGRASIDSVFLLVEPAEQVPGDYNGDGAVDAADRIVSRMRMGQVVPVGSSADGDHDGRIDAEDSTVWRANYGRRAR